MSVMFVWRSRDFRKEVAFLNVSDRPTRPLSDFRVGQERSHAGSGTNAFSQPAPYHYDSSLVDRSLPHGKAYLQYATIAH